MVCKPQPGRFAAGLLAGAGLIALVLTAGCAHGRYGQVNCPPNEKPVCYPRGMCSGYFPTCWRRWPDECPGCPVYVPPKAAQPSAAEVEGEPIFSPPSAQEENGSLPLPGESPDTNDASEETPSDEGPAPDMDDAPRQRATPGATDESGVWRSRVLRFFAYAPNLHSPAEASASDE